MTQDPEQQPVFSPRQPCGATPSEHAAGLDAEPSAAIGAALWARSEQLIRDGSRFGGDHGDREFGCGMQEALRALGVPKP